MLTQRACYRIGNKMSIYPWTDLWVLGVACFRPEVKAWVDMHFISRVVDFKLQERNSWNSHLVNNLFIEEPALAILEIQWHDVHCHDKLI